MNADTNADLLKYIEGIVTTLEYHFASYDLNGFIEWIEQTYQTKIILLPFENFPSGVFGAWLKSLHFHLIFFDARALPFQQNHSILHEVAHILLLHPAPTISTELAVAILEGVLGDQSTSLDFILPYLLKRSLGIAERHEMEAEVMALVIQAQARTAKVRSNIEYGSSNTELRALLWQLGALSQTPTSNL